MLHSELNTKGVANMDARLRDKTLALLQDRPRKMSFQDISDATGISKAWLSKFSSGGINDPGVMITCTLYAYLTGKPLELGE